MRFMRAAFVYCDGWLFAPRDDPTVIRVSAAGSAFRALILSIIYHLYGSPEEPDDRVAICMEMRIAMDDA